MSESHHAAYKASLSRSQGREGWSIIFRHPVRVDEATGKAGKRVRRGLGTRDQGEASPLVEQMNGLLADQAYWQPSSRSTAEQRFDPRIVEIFFDRMVPEETDFLAIRDEHVPLPNSTDDDYRRLLLLGTTGAGKTTLVRQLLGTDPEKDRFPSTSTARTTIADAEFILATGAFQGVVTFHQRDEVRAALEDCVSAGVLAAYEDSPDQEILRRLLNHVDQRFRFGYVLGTGKEIFSRADNEDEDDDDEEEEEAWEDLGGDSQDVFDPARTNQILKESIVNVRELARGIGSGLRAKLSAEGEDDDRVIDELFEEECDRLVREEDRFHETVDGLFDQVEERFDLLDPKALSRNRQGWPSYWYWSTPDRNAFLREMRRFSSNFAPHYGRLLTPLVNGIRASGPFAPTWKEGDAPRFVILDGEGLGHTPDSSSSVPTSVMRRIREADAIILVDNALQPMQAASIAAMKEIVSSGNISKLLTCFTHFDGVVADNLPTRNAKKQHILASAEAVLTGLRGEMGSPTEKRLRDRLDHAAFFVGGIHGRLIDARADRKSIEELRQLVTAAEHVLEKPEPTQGMPVYSKMNLVFAVQRATQSFHTSWQARLGLSTIPGTEKEHWARIKALARRFAERLGDGYEDLKPVADLRQQLQNTIADLIRQPVRWDGVQPSDDEEQAKFDLLCDQVSGGLLELASARIQRERHGEWHAAFYLRGRGSTFERTKSISEEIYAKAAPIPDVTPSLDGNRFLTEVAAIVDKAAEECKAKLE